MHALPSATAHAPHPLRLPLRPYQEEAILDAQTRGVLRPLVVLPLGAGPAAGSEELEVPEELRELWEERAAIMAGEGGLPPAKAERLAWRCFDLSGEEQYGSTLTHASHFAS